MSALNLFDITPKFSTFTMSVMFTDEELFVGFKIICSTLTRLWYGQETLGYPALLILLQCCAINICASDISWSDFTTAERIHLNSVLHSNIYSYPCRQSFHFLSNV
jgi:hypothetical protein